ncbi:MAG: T9SS type A sorting domain-containing protein, partial [Cyclobacteriaceae bacterium]|nr:T9SS type A sorting domain-containing protein [Cyclobacteriaceae bacterium]
NPAPSTPTSAVGVITIRTGHTVTVPSGFSVTADQLTVQSSATLEIEGTGTLTIADGAGNDLTINTGASLNVFGTLILNNSAVIAGSTATTTTFQSGSVYVHQYTTTQGAIPLATWDAASTLRITGYTTFTTATAAGNWGQSFGNVEWNCTGQTATLNLGGLLTTIQGNLSVLSTGTTGVLRFLSTSTGTINIGGNFSVSGNSRISFATTGNCTVNVGGNYSQNLSAGYVRFADGADGIGTLNISGDFTLNAGVLTENGGGAAQGNINFVGPAGTVHTFFEAGTPTTTLSNQLAYSVAADNELIISGESQIAGGATSFFTVGANAIVYVQSTDAAGAIQLGTGQGTTTGNIRVTNGNRIYGSGAQVIYNGSAAQFMGNGQPTAAGITTIIDNPSGVTQVAATTLTLNGNLTLQTGNLTVTNASLTINGITDLQGGDILFTTGGTARNLIFSGDVLLSGDIDVVSGTANANVTFNGDITGGGVISFSGLNSNLTLGGSGDIVFPLSGPTDLETLICNRAGEVTFNQNLNINTNAGASTFNISNGTVIVNGNVNGRDINITGSSVLIINGNTSLSNSFSITGTAETNGTLVINNDLTISAASLLDANGNVTVNDDVFMSGGAIFNFEDQTVTLNSQLNNPVSNPGFFFANENSVLNILNTGTFTGDGSTNILAFDPSGNVLGTFLINRPTAGTLVAINSALTIANTFQLTDGDFRNISGLNFQSGATLIRNSAAAFTGGSAVPTGGPYDLIYQGTSLTTGVEAQGSLDDVTSNATGTVTLGSAMTAAGTLLISSGTFTCGANAVSVNNFTHSGTTFNAPSSNLTITGNMQVNGTFNRNNGTVIFNGASAISGTVNPLFQNVTINGTLTSPTNLTLTGNWVNNGTFIPGSGAVTFTNTTNGTKTISGTATTRFNNLNVQNNTAATDVSVNGNVEVQGVITLSSGAVLDADGPGTGVLTLLSTSDDPTEDASIAALAGGAAVTGNVTVQRYMTIEGPSGSNNRIYRYISSPVQNATVADIQNEIPVTGSFTGSSTCTGCLTNPSMFTYNETVTTGGIDNGYEAFPVSSNTEQLVPGRGYAIFVRGNINPIQSAGSALFDVRGPINSGTVSLGNPTGLTFTSSGVLANDGWNLVGNPFPSTIDWNAATGWTRPAALDATIYIRDNGNDPQRYATWNGVTGTNGGSRYIAMGQAFWVKLNSGPSPATLSANENVKVAGTQTTFFRSSSPTDLLRITLKSGQKEDETVIHFREDATTAFDSHADAWKLANASINLSTLLEDGKKVAINSLSPFNCSSEVKLDISNVSPGSYTFSFSEFESFSPAAVLQLVDNFTGTVTNIRTSPTYTFNVTSAPSSYGSNRFKVLFSSPAINADFSLASAVVCNQQGGIIQINNSQNGVSYAARFNGELISDIKSGNGSTVELTLQPGTLPVGTHSILIEAFVSGCKVVKNHTVLVETTQQLSGVQHGESCLSGSVQLKALGVPSGGTVRWFESANDVTPVFVGENFTTPVLDQSRTYYVNVLNSNGCESEKIPVNAVVHQFEAVSLTYDSATSTLRSTYAEGNQWYRNGVLIPGATGQELVVDRSGVYKVVVKIGTCETSAEMPLVITADEEMSMIHATGVYPNPTEGVVNLKFKEESQVFVMNSHGQLIGKLTLKKTQDHYEGTFDMGKFPSGLYVFKAYGGGRSSTIKVLKR